MIFIVEVIKMRKLISLMLIVTLSLCLTGCDLKSYYDNIMEYFYNQSNTTASTETTTSIEITSSEVKEENEESSNSKSSSSKESSSKKIIHLNQILSKLRRNVMNLKNMPMKFLGIIHIPVFLKNVMLENIHLKIQLVDIHFLTV